MDVSPYHVLGLPKTASREQVKEEFRKLCLQYHPDKVDPGVMGKPAAEARFREIKAAYDSILRGQAGYAPPPPGTSASQEYARAYYRAHHHGVDPEGPVRCGGPYGGFATERDFYRAMFRTTRNNPFVLILLGLAAIPAISAVVSATNGNNSWVTRFKEEGIFMFTQNRFKINGRETVRTNPYSIRAAGEDNMQDSYIYKSEKYRHLRAALNPNEQGSSSSSSSSSAPQQ